MKSSKTLFVNFYTITELQQKIMRYIDYWAHTEKTPISQKKILIEMERTNHKRETVLHALNGLLKQGYIRRAITISSGENGIGAEKTKYVMLRGLNP